MQEKLGRSIVMVSVAPGHVEKALQTFRQKPSVERADVVMGNFDIALEVTFRSLEELRKFQAEIQRIDYVRDYKAYPGFDLWTNGGANNYPFHGLVLLQTSHPREATEDLKQLSSVEEIIGTFGDSDLILRVGAEDQAELFQTVLGRVQMAPGARATETFLALPTN